jgi:hypothetical protein
MLLKRRKFLSSSVGFVIGLNIINRITHSEEIKLKEKNLFFVKFLS